MLRFLFFMILALGLFSFAGAKEASMGCYAPEYQEMDDLPALTEIDPVVRRAVLKQVSNIWEISFNDLDDAYSHGYLTIEETMYGSDLAYDVTYGSLILCILDSDI